MPWPDSSMQGGPDNFGYFSEHQNARIYPQSAWSGCSTREGDLYLMVSIFVLALLAAEAGAGGGGAPAELFKLFDLREVFKSLPDLPFGGGDGEDGCFLFSQAGFSSFPSLKGTMQSRRELPPPEKLWGPKIQPREGAAIGESDRLSLC